METALINSQKVQYDNTLGGQKRQGQLLLSVERPKAQNEGGCKPHIDVGLHYVTRGEGMWPAPT